ncbi:hypothetical protein EW146_g10366 [Bondarzewia mesenterica]|uniref:Decapping nuclease n=1 Tax=Bondarzewia mesenterica TaxID=1095465 RepID=A0A4S4KXR3_9AGAM|nr:hypothetical protein EW146_g10366 [Bondarzewia mesenterica]
MTSVKRSVSTVLEGEDPSDQQRTELHFSSPHPPPLADRLSYPPISQPSARQIPFQQPLPLLTFSYTPAHELEFTDAAMRYYVGPPRDADLEHGYNRWVHRVEDKGRIDSLLRAYSKVRKQNEAGMANVDVGVVGWRGVMTKILTAPYEERDGWELNVMLVDGTLYLEEHSSNAQLERMPRYLNDLYETGIKSLDINGGKCIMGTLLNHGARHLAHRLDPVGVGMLTQMYSGAAS